MSYNIDVVPIVAQVVCEVFLLSTIVTRKGRSAAICLILAIAHIGTTRPSLSCF